jgi:hypothetical protein
MKSCEYAVVSWFNYRKECKAGFIRGFDDFEEARKYAYSLAESEKREDEEIITEDKISHSEGCDGGPYKSIIGYGATEDGSGYETTFYCVVKWFTGVTNSWCWEDDESESESDESGDDEWRPRY